VVLIEVSVVAVAAAEPVVTEAEAAEVVPVAVVADPEASVAAVLERSGLPSPSSVDS